MYAATNVVLALSAILDSLLMLLSWVIIASAVISWLQAPSYNPIVRIIDQITSPLYRAVQSRMNTFVGGLDLTPILILVAISFVRMGIIPSIQQWAMSLS